MRTETETFKQSLMQNVEKPPSITSLACPTKNRLDSLRQLLESFVPNLKQFGRTSDFIVMDDSPKAESRKESRSMLRALSEELGVNILYGGAEEKILFVKKLIEKKHVPPDLIKFALFDTSKSGIASLGANRNAILLDTAGSLMLSVDDDIRCLTATSPNSTGDVSILPQQNPPEEIRVFASREEALQSVKVASCDFLGAQEQFLGKEICDDLSAFRKTFNASHRIENGVGSDSSSTLGNRVVVTTNGYVGDCGWGTPTRYFTLRGKSLDHFTRSEAAYRTGCASREVVQYVDQLVITGQTERMMGGCYGLDNRMLIPPFMPIGRGEDHIWGRMISRYISHAHFANLPQIVLHAPVDPRKFWNGEITRSASGINFPTFISALLDSFKQQSFSANSQDNLILLGKQLEELGQMSQSAFEANVRQAVTCKANSVISELESLLEEMNNSPEYWVNDVHAYIRIMREAMVQDEFVVPCDLLYEHNYREALGLIQYIIVKYGRLLIGWPELLDVTKCLSNEGHRIAKRV